MIITEHYESNKTVRKKRVIRQDNLQIQQIAWQNKNYSLVLILAGFNPLLTF